MSSSSVCRTAKREPYAVVSVSASTRVDANGTAGRLRTSSQTSGTDRFNDAAMYPPSSL
ncbi:hypothetical protein [Streptomyces pinistramenti]|uniref:hypothetical protein n=1 Tax=Streptomyces pinistramenti TaxID=2884812 RepID=UPI001D072FAB|nr:hypothetical protein [Streptomyces pinistramenti]MCB5909068.1 hypothetical protein [Streptomyces pinistramenti]